MNAPTEHSFQEQILILAEKYGYFKKRDRGIVEEKLAQWDEEKLKSLWNRLKKLERESVHTAFRDMELKERTHEDERINHLLAGELEME